MPGYIEAGGEIYRWISGGDDAEGNWENTYARQIHFSDDDLPLRVSHAYCEITIVIDDENEVCVKLGDVSIKICPGDQESVGAFSVRLEPDRANGMHTEDDWGLPGTF